MTRPSDTAQIRIVVTAAEGDSHNQMKSADDMGGDEPSSSRTTPDITPVEADDVTYVELKEYDPSNRDLPDGWEYNVHPNGLPYFVNKELRAVTYANIKDSTVLHAVKGHMARIVNLFHTCSIPFTQSDDWEVIIELQAEEKPSNGPVLSHVLVDHSKRRTIIFRNEVPEYNDRQQVYWDQVRRTPMHRSLSPGAEEEMLGALAHYYTARIQGDQKTTSPFSHVQCEQFISLYKIMKSETTPTNGVRTWFVSHVMVFIWTSRDAHNYGEFNAIPKIERMLEDPPTWKQRIFNILVYILCLGTHQRYREQLKFAYANGGLYVPAFQKSLQDMLQEWTDSNLLGTVFVSASVAFLSVQEIQKTQQTMVLVSTCFSMASIISGVHHLWRHRSKTHIVLHDIQSRVIHHAARKSGESQAIKTTLSAVFLSFPLVFLMWSVLSFSLALLHFAFRHTQGVSKILLACIVSVILFTTICVRLFFYTIWSDPHEEPSNLKRSYAAVKRSTKRWKAWSGHWTQKIGVDKLPTTQAGTKLQLMLMKFQGRLRPGTNSHV